MRPITQSLLTLGLAFTTLILTGCSESTGGRVEVSGTVKLKGELIKNGVIEFVPVENQGTMASTPFSNGTYRISADKGLKPGKYVIRVTAGDGKTPYGGDEPPGPGGAPGPGGNTNIISKELVPKDWNVNSKQERTITKEGPNKFDFDIP